MKTSVRIAVMYAMIFIFRREGCCSHSHNQAGLKKTKAVVEPESLGWSPRNAGIVSIVDVVG